MSLGIPDYPLRFADMAPSSWRRRANCLTADLGDFFEPGAMEAGVFTGPSEDDPSQGIP